MAPTISTVLSTASYLTDSSSYQQGSSDLKGILLSRLTQYYANSSSQGTVSAANSLEEVQLATAIEALNIVEKVQRILDVKEPLEDVPIVGTRDLGQLRILLSMVFRWAIEPLLDRVGSSWPNKPVRAMDPRLKIIDLTSTPEDYKLLSSLMSRLMALLFPGGINGHIPQTLITTTMLNRHVADILKPSLCLGWLPKSLSSDSMPTLDAIRPTVMRLLSVLPPSQTIVALGSVLSSAHTVPPHVLKTSASLLSKQLFRPQGVKGLFASVFGDDPSSDDAPLEKLEHVAKVLTASPASMKADEYYNVMVPRIIAILSEPAPPSHRRAAAFIISRMLSTDNDMSPHPKLLAGIVLPILHTPLLEITPLDSSKTSALAPEVSLTTLTSLVTNTDPSPTLLSILLSPIISSIYSLLSHLDRIKTSDPDLKTSLRGLLTTWGRIVSATDGIDVLWTVIEGEGGNWKVDLEGRISRISESEEPPALSLLTPEDLRRADETGDFDMDDNLLNLRPDPVHFVRFLKSIDRADVSSELFVKLLEVYRDQKLQQESDPKRTLLYLQLIVQMQTQLSEGGASSNILSKPEHILSFVKHALETANTTTAPVAPRPPRRDTTLRMEDLRMVPEDEDSSDEGDNDDNEDDAPGSKAVSPDNEMTDTAVNLLLSILEANEDLSARTAPVLNDIFSLLEPLTNDASPSIRTLAREARIVMTARLASTSAPSKSSSSQNGRESVQETYQKALKLLQDPILPVRAHGLLLLRQLVTPSQRRNTSTEDPSLDPALMPAILSIFLQSVQDDDSYLFLNAVQGLAAMVDTFGKDVLKALVKAYSEGLDGLGATSMTQQDVDTRVRIGEALGQVIRKCGDTLGIYVDILVPPLFRIVRSSDVPTTLRTSSLSLLAECISTHPSSLLHYTTDLAEAMIDLVQIETVPSNQVPTKGRPSPDTKEQEDEEDPIPTMDSQPTSTNSKFPPLRRAALHFLALLLREMTTRVYESTFSNSMFTSSLMKRSKTTLAYVSSTDEDVVVRVMARETGEGLEQLERAMIGL